MKFNKKIKENIIGNLLKRYYEAHDKKVTIFILVSYFIFSLGIFILPSDLLSKFQICQEFVNFMKQYFINIEIFSGVSSFKEEIEFYVSYMWVVGLLWALEAVFYTICRFFIFYNSETSETIKRLDFKWLIFGFSFSIFAIYVYSTGYIVTDGISFFAWDYSVMFQNKLEIFIVISLFQALFSGFGVYLLAVSISVLFYKIFCVNTQKGRIL